MTAGKVNHRLVIYTHDGVRLAVASNIQSWEISRTLNGMGWFNVTVSRDFDHQLLSVDRLVEFWREPFGGVDRLEMVGFMRYWEWAEMGGKEIIRFGGPDQVELLDRRVVAYYATTSEADKTGPADDVIKEVVREGCNFPEAGLDWHAPFARPRYYPAANFTVDPDFGDGFAITRQFAWRDLLPTIQELAEYSKEKGIPVWFDVVPTGVPAQFIFQTFTDVRGIDRSMGSGVQPVIFSKESANLSDPLLRYDFTEEINYVFGGGQGEGLAREIDPENDQVREHMSIWNKRERFQDARECGRDRPCIAARAFEMMEEGKPRVIFSGNLLDTPQARYGVDWNLGDRVTARYRGLEFDGDVRQITISVNDEGLETVTAAMEVVKLMYGHPT